MKYLIISLLSLLVIFISNEAYEKYTNDIDRKAPSFQVLIDTFDVEITGELRKVAKFHGKYYCIFESKREHSTKEFKKLLVLDEDGEFVEDVFLPSGIQDMHHYSFYTENDSLYLKRDQLEKENFVLKEYEAEFSQVNVRDFALFEDDSFRVLSSCQGEWGGTIFFEDKESGDFFEGNSTCTLLVNKIGNDYFILNYLAHMLPTTSFMKVSDPKELIESDGNLEIRTGSGSIEGMEILLDTFNLFVPTFIELNEEPKLLYSDKSGTYLGEINNKVISPIYKFDFSFNSRFCQLIDQNSQLLVFYLRSTDDFGILDIEKNKMTFHIVR